MNSNQLKKAIWSFTDWELKAILDLQEPDSVKDKMIRRELALRKKERKNGTYVDKTVNPKVPLDKRVES